MFTLDQKQKKTALQMTEAHKKLCHEFEVFEKARGIRNTKRIMPHLKPFLRYLDEKEYEVNEVGYRHAQEFQTWLVSLLDADGTQHYATFSVKTIISYVSRFYSFLKTTGRIPMNPFLGIKRIKTEKKLPYSLPVEENMAIILDELSRFWEAGTVREQRMYYRTHVMAELMYATGLRISEVLALEESDIDFENRTVLVRDSKEGGDRIAWLDEYAVTVLRLYVREMKETIAKNKGSRTVFGIGSPATVTQVFHKYLRRVCMKHGISRFTSHAFRHTLGFHLLRRGCDMRYIQLILGHKDMNTTTIYTKVDKIDLRNELDSHHPRRFREE